MSQRPLRHHAPNRRAVAIGVVKGFAAGNSGGIGVCHEPAVPINGKGHAGFADIDIAYHIVENIVLIASEQVIYGLAIIAYNRDSDNNFKAVIGNPRIIYDQIARLLQQPKLPFLRNAGRAARAAGIQRAIHRVKGQPHEFYA
ncbi:hypothetical protein DSECCO2_661380 [anaerobic digester metagenome]